MSAAEVLDVEAINRGDVAAAARAYLAAGLRPVPIHGIGSGGTCGCARGPACSAPGKHPVGNAWQKKRIALDDVAAAWRDGRRGVGLVLGDGLIALDVDGVAGRVTLEALEAAHGALPPTMTARSGRAEGGEHRYFRIPDGVDARNRVKVGPGLDVRAAGGQCVAPPTLHASGARYEWTRGGPIAELPAAWLELLVEGRRRSAYASAAVRRAADAITAAPQGQRNDTLNREAYSIGGLVAVGEVDEAHARAELEEAARAAGLETAEARATIESGMRAGKAAPRTPSARPSGKPTIRTGVDLDRVVDEAIRALATDSGVYQRGGYLVHVIRDATAGAPIVRRLATATLRERLCGVARWEKHDGRTKSYVACVPPDDVVNAVAARGEWAGIRPLVGVLEAPSLRPDGTVIQARGYDDRTGFLLDPLVEYPPVPDAPTRAQALAALEELEEVIEDFPFAKPAHRSAAIAMLLTLVARPAIEGACPMGAVDATTRGTGKGRLVDALANVATGRDAAKTPLPEDDEECGKLVSSIVAEGAAIAVLDNIARAIELPSLDNALTSTTWKARALGHNSTIYAPHRTVWLCTGNNLEYGADLARRVLPIRLESPLENPEDRDDFRHPDLLGWVRRERPRLVRAALTILRAHAVAGRPACGCKALGSFESWSAVIPPALVWLGRANPLDARIDVSTQSDRTRDGLAALLDAWARIDPTGCGLTAAQVLRLVYPPGFPPAPLPPDAAELREAIESVAPATGGKPPSAAKLGAVLRRFRKRVIGGRMFDSRPARAGVVAWVVCGSTEDRPAAAAAE